MFTADFVKRNMYSIELDDGTILSSENECDLEDLYDEWLEDKCVEIYSKWKEQGAIILDEDFNVAMGRMDIKERKSRYFKFKEATIDDLYYVLKYLGYLVDLNSPIIIPYNTWVMLDDTNYYPRFIDIESRLNKFKAILIRCNKAE